MGDNMFSIGIGVMLITYCLLVHSVIKVPEIGVTENKLRDNLFVLLICEMLIMTIFRV